MRDIDNLAMCFIAMIVFGLVGYTVISIKINAKEQMAQIIDNGNACIEKMEADRVWLYKQIEEYKP